MIGWALNWDQPQNLGVGVLAVRMGLVTAGSREPSEARMAPVYLAM